MGRKQSTAFRSVKGEGRKVNVDTGVEIVTMEFLGKRTGDYEVRGPALNDAGYIVVGMFDNLAAAKSVAVATVEALFGVQLTAFDAATKDIIAEYTDIEAQVRETGNKVLITTWESGFAGVFSPLFAHLPSTPASASRLHRIKAILAGTETAPTNAEVAEQLAYAREALSKGTEVFSPKRGEAGVVSADPYVFAEYGRVIVQVKFSGGRYASCYAETLIPSLV